MLHALPVKQPTLGPCLPVSPFPPAQNPRILLLLRFVSDVMGAVSIITSSTTKTEQAPAAVGTTAAAATSPAAAALAEGADKASHAGSGVAAAVEATIGDAAAGTGAAAQAAAAAAQPGGGGGTQEPGVLPLETMVQLTNVGVVLPCSSSTTNALGATVEHLVVALPGA